MIFVSDDINGRVNTEKRPILLYETAMLLHSHSPERNTYLRITIFLVSMNQPAFIL